MKEMMRLLPWFYLLLINGVEIYLMYYDKRQARRKQFRVSEITLLTIGAIGGGIGGFISQQLFRHKTKKLSFYFFNAVGTLVAIALIYFCYKT